VEESGDVTEQELVQIFEETQALRAGHFELRSGLHSDQFFQCALLLQHPQLTARLCAELIAQAGVPVPDVVIAPALGGITVGYEIGRQYGARAVFAEKAEGRLVLRRGFEIRPGERVVIAEDVVTRGGRVQEVVDIVTGLGGEIAAILVLVDRSGGRAAWDAPLHSLLKITPSTWDPGSCPLCRAGVPLEHPGS
jgi:orotate phosphoribosyltransferase